MIIGFWVVMTLLLVRMVWFPERSQLAGVPPTMVWQLFVRQDSVATEMHLYNPQHERIGLVHIATREQPPDSEGRPRFDLMVNGRLEDHRQAGAAPPTMTWNASSEVVDGEELSRLRFNLRMPASDFEVSLQRSEDEPLNYTVQQAGRTLLDSSGGGTHAAMLGPAGRLLPGLGFGLDALKDGPGSGQSGQWEAALQVDARQAMIDYGGRLRPGYRLETRLLKRHGAVLEFTEAGELLRVQTDDGHVLINPVYFGDNVVAPAPMADDSDHD